jgi:hypothetical protein
MSQAKLRRDVAAWPADQRDWYLNLVAQADGGFGTVDELHGVLERYDALTFDRCIFLTDKGEDRVTDVNGELWGNDLDGRWFLSSSKPFEWLHRRIACLGGGGALPVGKSEVASHICGYCFCIRAEHIKFQSKGEDVRDKRHHKAVGRGNIRPQHMPKHLVIESPVSVMQ